MVAELSVMAVAVTSVAPSESVCVWPSRESVPVASGSVHVRSAVGSAVVSNPSKPSGVRPSKITPVAAKLDSEIPRPGSPASVAL